MKYLLIENKITEPIDLAELTVLGASTSRGKEKKIGQFGSGFLYTLALFARKDLLSKTTLFLPEKFDFGTKKHSETLKSIYMCSNELTLNLNISTEFGIMDWHDVGMGIREFVSNAIDSGNDYSVKLVEDMEPLENHVRVYIELESEGEVLAYYNELPKHFLMLQDNYDENKQVLIKEEGSIRPARFYRKGVLVGEIGETSLFDYNINDLSLKESRIIDSYEAEKKAAIAVKHADKETLKHYLMYIMANEKFFERKFNSYYLQFAHVYGEEKQRATKIWKESYAEVKDTAVPVDNAIVAHAVQSKGYQVTYYDAAILHALSVNGIKTSSQILSADEREGRTIIEATQECYDSLNYCWAKLKAMELVNKETEKPALMCFEENIKSGSRTLGFYKDGTIYIHNDVAQYGFTVALVKIMLEELVHYITGAEDFTRDFQDLAFKLAAKSILRNK